MIRALPMLKGTPISCRNGAFASMSCIANRFALRIESIERADDAERAQRDDERRHLHARHERRHSASRRRRRTDRPSGNAIRIGTPSTTASRPITTDEMTMMTPTERSMPAVRMTKRLRDAEDADDRHLRQDGRQIAAGDEMRVVDRAAQQKPQHQHDERNGRRIGVEEALQRAWRRKGALRRTTPASSKPRSEPFRTPAEWAATLRSWHPLVRFPVWTTSCEIGARG